MISAEPYKRLKTLTQHAELAHEQYYGMDITDEVLHLPAERRVAWCHVLSSLASTEAIQEALMSQVEKTFRNNSVVSRYIETHKLDELRHHQILNTYLKNTFDYEKKKRTISDRVIYDAILPHFSRLLARKPVYGLAKLYFFAISSVGVYKNFKRQAEADGLRGLTHIVSQIEKDELRHMAGLETLIAENHRLQGKLSRADLLVVRAFLELLAVDVNMSRWALHNREVRAHALKIGLSPETVTQGARKAIAGVLQVMETSGLES